MIKVPDMDIPEHCGECPFCVGNLRTFCWVTEKKFKGDYIKVQGYKAPDCPLKKDDTGFRVFSGFIFGIIVALLLSIFKRRK